MPKNTIPLMTHPLSRYWDQPDPSEIIVTDKCALMTPATFNALPEYSATNPSGVYEGKMWRRNDGAFDREFLAKGGKPVWYLCWYGFSSNPDCVFNNRRKIKLLTVDVLVEVEDLEEV